MIRGRDFLNVDAFLENRPEEEFVRTRIGRQYYAAYLEARGFCEASLGYERMRNGREHQDVARLLSAIDPDLSSRIRFLRGLRNGADYDLDLSLETLTIQMRQAGAVARRIINRLDELADASASR